MTIAEIPTGQLDSHSHDHQEHVDSTFLNTGEYPVSQEFTDDTAGWPATQAGITAVESQTSATGAHPAPEPTATWTSTYNLTESDFPKIGKYEPLPAGFDAESANAQLDEANREVNQYGYTTSMAAKEAATVFAREHDRLLDSDLSQAELVQHRVVDAKDALDTLAAHELLRRTHHFVTPEQIRSTESDLSSQHQLKVDLATDARLYAQLQNPPHLTKAQAFVVQHTLDKQLGKINPQSPEADQRAAALLSAKQYVEAHTLKDSRESGRHAAPRVKRDLGGRALRLLRHHA